MRRFVGFSEKVKYLGLIGILGVLFRNKILECFWLFWLFGFIGIFYNYPVFLQSLKQLWGIIIIPHRYGSSIPSVDNYRCKVKYSLPFRDEWTVVNGGVEKNSSHSWEIPTQRYAYDFLILDNNGKSTPGGSKEPADYYCYGKEVLAPADGVVIEAISDYPDSLILKSRQVDCSAHDIRGNYILIQHVQGEYSLLAHLKPASVLVKMGDKVKRGECIAHCGNSGNSSEPHLHFQLQDGVNFFTSAGLPVEFERITVRPDLNYSTFDSRRIPSDYSERYLTRGRRVENLSE